MGKDPGFCMLSGVVPLTCTMHDPKSMCTPLSPNPKPVLREGFPSYNPHGTISEEDKMRLVGQGVAPQREGIEGHTGGLGLGVEKYLGKEGGPDTIIYLFH